MSKILDNMTVFMQEKLDPLFSRFAALPFIQAMSSSFAAFMPLTMIGGLATLLITLSWGPYVAFLQATHLDQIFNLIYNLTLNMMGVWTAAAIGYYYSVQKGMKKYAMVNIFVTMFAYFLLAPYTASDAGNVLNMGYLGAKGIVAAMVVGFVVVHVYKFCVEKNIYIKMPEQVPVYLQESFSGIIPAGFIGILFAAIELMVERAGFVNAIDAFYTLIAAPLTNIGTSFWGLFILFALPSILWFFGIHGGNATQAIIPPLLMPLAIENATAWAAGQPLPHDFTMGTMALMSGGGLICWTILMLQSKSPRFKTLGRMTVITSLFGLSEPINFGLPLVLNPYLFIPQIIPLHFVLTYIVTKLGILPPAHCMYVWGVPMFMSGYLAAGFAGVVWQLVLTVVDYFWFLPFFKAYEKKELEEEAATLQAESGN
ncbi:MAG: PTS sugar transporter subunit IIC [Erysipelotrichaceae bacterium]|nr:PTS sugar transporter subunit IIC [Erysipelotrichaceae bacterium]